MTEMFRHGSNAKHSLISNNQSSTKLCHIVKFPEFEGYGFSLHSEKVKPGQYIGKVDNNSPAKEAGLKEGDRIIEVNGVNITLESHKQVVQRIKSLSQEVRLLIQEILGDNTNEQMTTFKASKANINKGSRDVGGIRNEISISGKNTTNNCVKSTQLPMTDEMEITGQQINKNCAEKHTDGTSHLFLWPPHGDSFTSKIASTPAGSGQFSNRSLELPTTAAEMRAKLSLKKKYDPKNEVVDLKTKFEIIQKL